MTFTRLYRYTALCIAALFLLMQSVSIAHASAYGDAPHDHDGVSCAVSLIAESEAEAQPPAPQLPQPALTSAPQPSYITLFSSVKLSQNRSRDPPPRGPPSNQN